MREDSVENESTKISINLLGISVTFTVTIVAKLLCNKIKNQKTYALLKLKLTSKINKQFSCFNKTLKNQTTLPLTELTH